MEIYTGEIIMKYYVIDRKGNVWGEAPSMAQAKQIMDDCIADFIRTGLGPEAIQFANMRIIDEVEAMVTELNFEYK